jgi:hypothetical protein
MADSIITCYPISGSITVYKDCSRSGGELSIKKGTIYYSDAVTILYSRGPSSYVRYPITGGGTKDGWIKTSSVLKPTTASYRSEMWGAYVNQFIAIKSASSRINTYRHPNSNNRCGSIYVGDTVWVYSSMYGYTQVRYPTSNGYKIAWVNNSDLGLLK